MTLHRPDVRAGQIYDDGKRRLLVESVETMKKTVGRFRQHYTYATCRVIGFVAPEKRTKIDTDRLRSRAFDLIVNPIQEDACPVPPRLNDAALPQAEP
jgi:hypothetical protein